MRHQTKKNTLGKAKDQREALLRSLATELFTHGEIKTTMARAKALRPYAENIITIAKKDDVLVFVEVKSLPSGNADTLAHELDLRKQRKIIKTANFFLSKNREYNSSRIRFDVIVIDMPNLPSVYHIQDAFSEFV